MYAEFAASTTALCSCAACGRLELPGGVRVWRPVNGAVARPRYVMSVG